MTPTSSSLLALAERVEGLTRSDNSIDVLVEVAMFEPDEEYTSIRANDAGTKVILTGHDRLERTFWPQDWTMDAEERAATAAALKARAQSGEQA